MAEQGPNEMRKGLTAGWALAALAGSVLMGAPSQAQELSQKSIEKLMEYAWAITPDRFTKPNGQTVEIDRKNPKSVEIPVDFARDVIRVGRLSAHAQMCELKEEHAANFRTFMAREAVKKRWSEQQFVFINQLHMVTVMLLTGQLKVIETEEKEGKEVQVAEEAVGKKASCSQEQKAKVKEAVTAYLKSGPQLAPADTAAGGFVPSLGVPPAAVPASAPAAVPQKK